MIDAEQSYFQPAIDHLVLDMMQRYNKKTFIVYTTVQCYLKGAQKRLTIEMERAQRQKYFFAAKLVRGAYMISERKRAEEQVRKEGGREGGRERGRGFFSMRGVVRIIRCLCVDLSLCLFLFFHCRPPCVCALLLLSKD
jgi:hypothetical protein